jgi:hypothetical protein
MDTWVLPGAAGAVAGGIIAGATGAEPLAYVGLGFFVGAFLSTVIDDRRMKSERRANAAARHARRAGKVDDADPAGVKPALRDA